MLFQILNVLIVVYFLGVFFNLALIFVMYQDDKELQFLHDYNKKMYYKICLDIGIKSWLVYILDTDTLIGR